jgi:hypothetical protein
MKKKEKKRWEEEGRGRKRKEAHSNWYSQEKVETWGKRGKLSGKKKKERDGLSCPRDNLG